MTPGPDPALRPVSVKVIAILGIIFAAIGLIGSVVGLWAWFAIRFVDLGAMEIYDLMMRHPGVRTMALTNLIVGTALSVMLLWASILALKFNPRGRAMFIAYACISVAVQIASTIASLMLYPPRVGALDQIAFARHRGLPAQSPRVYEFLSEGGMALRLVFAAVWIIAILIIMTRPKVKAAFAAWGGKKPI
jgi:hypothetical protein